MLAQAGEVQRAVAARLLAMISDSTLTSTPAAPFAGLCRVIVEQVVSGPVSYGRPQTTFAIGRGCKVCERSRCRQRAAPSLLDH